jgi:hypothetical protein
MGSGVRAITLFPAGRIQHFRDPCLPESRDQPDVFYYEACVVPCCRVDIDIPY